MENLVPAVAFCRGVGPRVAGGTGSATSLGMRSVRRFSQVLLTLVGGAIVIYAVMRVDALPERLLYAALGLLIMEIGIWQVASFLFPNEREFKPLRKETDYFLRLVRRMNRAAVAAENGSSNAVEELDRVQEEMHHSIERMRRLAGVSDEAAGEIAKTALTPTGGGFRFRG